MTSEETHGEKKRSSYKETGFIGPHANDWGNYVWYESVQKWKCNWRKIEQTEQKTLTRRYEKRKEKINNSKTDEKALRSYRS